MVLGGTGMLGHVLIQTLKSSHDVTASVRGGGELSDVAKQKLQGIPLVSGVVAENFDSVAAALSKCQPDAIVNCIGIIKQTAAAKDPLPSIKVNSLFPHLLADWCRKNGSKLIHLSTDCVFSGRKGMPYTQDDNPDPVDLYGRSKLLGEVAGPNALTLRTSMIGRELRGHDSLVDWFLRQKGKTVKGFAKAIYSGLTTPVLARLIAKMIAEQPQLEGVWQVAADPINKYDLLHLIRDSFGLDIAIEQDTQFTCDRRLEGRLFQQATGFQAPTWPEMIAELAEISKTYQDE